MLFYVFSAEELRELFVRLGYPFEYDTIPRNVACYGARFKNEVYEFAAGSTRVFNIR